MQIVKWYYEPVWRGFFWLRLRPRRSTVAQSRKSSKSWLHRLFFFSVHFLPRNPKRLRATVLHTLISKLKSHSVTIDEEKAVSKYLHSMPAKYIQIALSIETMLDFPPSPSRI